MHMQAAHVSTRIHKDTHPQLLRRLGKEKEEEEEEKTVCRNSQRDTSCPKMPQAQYQEVSTSRPPAGSRILLRFWAHGTNNNALKITKKSQTNELWHLNYSNLPH